MAKKSKNSSRVKRKSRRIRQQRENTLGLVLIGVAVVLIIATFLYTANINNRQQRSDSGLLSEKAVKVEFYVMSRCPYGVQVEDAIAPVLDSLGRDVDFRLDFIATEVSPGQFQSLQGEPEVKGNIIQLCAAMHYPDKYMDLVTCMNKNMGQIPGNWEECAEGMNKAHLNSCYEGDEGKVLLRESIRRSQQRNASGSPTIFINDQEYSGARDSKSFLREICKHIPNNEECMMLPVEPIFEVIVLNDIRCGSDCDATRLKQATSYYFGNAIIRDVDASSEEGVRLIEKYGINKAPALLFDLKVETSENFKDSELHASFENLGDMYKLRDEATGATYWLDSDAQARHLADLGIILGDNRPQIDFFVMSYCPYGNQAEEAIEPAYHLLKEFADFNPRYVYYSNYQGGGSDFCLDPGNVYCSMHGIQEARQNIRELCASDIYGKDAWFDFALAMNSQCNFANADICFVQVARDLGFSPEEITLCEETRNIEFAEPDFRLGNALGARGSPAVFIDGKAYTGQRSPEGFKKAVCAAFESAPDVCSLVLDSDASMAEGSC